MSQTLHPSRRRLLGAGAALGGIATLGLAGCATTAGPSIGRVVVIGGGYGGATAARYLKMWGGHIDVTLVERNAQFVSCPISNYVLGGHAGMDRITRGYDGLKAMGVKLVQGEVTAIDAAGRKVRLKDGSELAYDRLVLSPAACCTAGRPARRPWRCASSSRPCPTAACSR
jgi:sulfite dehydrogenase